MPKTAEFQENLLGWFSGGAFWSPPNSGGWVGLLSSVPNPDSGNYNSSSVIDGEISMTDTGYERQAVTWNAPVGPDVNGTYISNNNVISFTNIGVDSWTVSGFAIFATSDGTTAASDVIAFHPLEASEVKTATTNDIIKFLASQLKYREQ